MASRKTRHSLLITQPCQDDLVLPRLKLLTYGQTLRSFIYKMVEDLVSVGTKIKRKAAKVVRDQEFEIYEMADIQSISQTKITEKILGSRYKKLG